MSVRRFDDVIVGQGLAGTTLAWQLRHSGRSVLVIDRDTGVTSSGIAAGLITPVTGQRLARAWRWDEFWPEACTFYERIERETQARFFDRRSMVRLFANVDEREMYDSRRAELGDLVRSPRPAVDPTGFHDPDGFEMPNAGVLNAPRYLQVSRTRLIADGNFQTADIEFQRDVVLVPDGVILPRLSVHSQRLTWCQGIAGATNPGFSAVRFNPAKGEILRLRIPGLTEQRVIHCGVWLLPLGSALFLAGATYDRDSVDCIPTPAGRDQIVRQLQMMLRLPFEIVGHAAANRPALHDFRPVLGSHPQHRQLAIFNGLGSRGALYAPGLAAELVDSLQNGSGISPEVNSQRWGDTSPDRGSGMDSGTHPRITELAHRLMQSRLQLDEIAVDATAGNGRDTSFLAATVGPDGHVFAIDIQEGALQRTSQRLQRLGFRNVTCLHGDHANLADLLPREVRGRVGAVMFNLGYLPGGDHAIVTQPASTMRGLHSAQAILRPGGVLTVVAYPGHGGGAEETSAVEQWFRKLPDEEWDIGESEPGGGQEPMPRLFWAVCR